MSELPEVPSQEKTERLLRLKRQAEVVLAKGGQAPAAELSHLELSSLLENLRIYQVELELQNDELRAAEQEAEAARRRYQTLFDEMPLAAFVVDAKGVVYDRNQLAEPVLGKLMPFVKYDGRLLQRFNTEDRTRFFSAVRDVLPKQNQVLTRMGLTQPDGPAAVFDVHLIGLSIDFQLDRRVLVLLVDRSADVAREQAQRFYTLLLDSSDSVIYAHDAQGTSLLANQALLNLLQRPRDQVVGQKREAYLPLRDAILHTEADHEVLRTGNPITIEEAVHMPPPRGRLDYLTRKFPLHDARGEVYGVGGISTDITHIKAQQRQTLLSEAVFMSSQDAIIVTDPETCIVRVNPAFTRQTGFSAESVLGEKTRLLKSGRQDASFYTEMWKALHGKGQWSGEINNRRADGTFYSVWSTINVVRDTDGTLLHYIAVQTDVTALHNAQVALARQAAYDDLTGLPNRTLFADRIAQLVATSKRQQKQFSLLFVDLDRFKEVNDTLGHQVGDELLREIGQRLQLGVRAEDTVARIGGDEFVVLLPNADQKGAQNLAGLLLLRLNEPLMLHPNTPYRPKASVGLATYPHDGQTPDELLRSADLAMYEAKLGGRNRTATYDLSMSQANDQSFEIQTDLAQAVALNQLRVFFQPKCLVADGTLVGAEVLVRWERPGHGLVRPGEFICIAEKTGLLVEIDRWVMRASLQQLGQWVTSGQWQAGWRLAVNQNVIDLQQPNMVEDLQSLLKLHQVAADALELEITEDALMEPTPVQLSHLQQLRQMGITLAIDDFGTGYSSLAYLRQLPVSVIKIDQQFVSSMLTQNSDAVLVRTIIEMAHNLGHTVVAEGIESVEQQAQLMQMGAEHGQGYLFGYPVNADEFAAQFLSTPPVVPLALAPRPQLVHAP